MTVEEMYRCQAGFGCTLVVSRRHYVARKRRIPVFGWQVLRDGREIFSAEATSYWAARDQVWWQYRHLCDQLAGRL